MTNATNERRPRAFARSWASTGDRAFGRIVGTRASDDERYGERRDMRRSHKEKEDGVDIIDGVRRITQETLMRRTRATETERARTREGRESASEREFVGWRRMFPRNDDDDGIGMRNEGSAFGKSVGNAMNAEDEDASVDRVKRTYKRGGERPWEAARRARDEKRAIEIERERARGRVDGENDGQQGASSSGGSAFARAGMPERAVAAMREAGLKRTTEIQRLAIPEIMASKNVVILAETGSGKTFAYVLPIVARMTELGRRGTKRSGRCCPAAVILVPNVELGKQVTYSAQLAASWCSSEDVPTPRVFSLVGKEKKFVKPAAKGTKKKATTKAGKSTKLDGDEVAIPEFTTADILVCTPARLLKLIKDEWVLLGRLCHVVVDEADEMLASGFGADVTELISMTYSADGMNKFDLPVQYIFAAATMRDAEPLLEAFSGELEWISTAQFGRVHPQLDLRVDDVSGEDAKFNALVQSLTRRNRFKALVFANSPEEADELVTKLDASGVTSLAFHGKAKERGVVLDDFISGDLAVCVCTDLAARGIDFPKLHHVVQYGAAPSMEMHLHRCGRTARTGQEGPFFVSCIVDSRMETVDPDVARALGLKRRYDRPAPKESEEEPQVV